jgi:hypothetical protein
LGGAGELQNLNDEMGIIMNKLSVLAATALTLVAGSALAADLKPRYTKAPPPPVVVSPWDFAFGSALMSDYVFRGVTQSAHGPAVSAYFEPRYNINESLQLYAGVGGASVSLPNRATMELDGYFGIRPTFGPLALDFGFWYYGYPGGQCSATQQLCGNDPNFAGNLGAGLPVNGNFIKKDLSFYEVYGKATYTFNDNFALGAQAYYTPSFLNSGAEGTYAEINAKFTAPSGMLSYGMGAYLSGAFGRQWLGTSDAFYGIPATVFASGINYADYNTWNVGVGLTYKVFTLDLRYSDTDLSKGNCNAFTSDYTTGTFGPQFVTPINPTGAASNWCGSTFIAKFSADLTAMSNLK